MIFLPNISILTGKSEDKLLHRVAQRMHRVTQRKEAYRIKGLKKI